MLSEYRARNRDTWKYNAPVFGSMGKPDDDDGCFLPEDFCLMEGKEIMSRRERVAQLTALVKSLPIPEEDLSPPNSIPPVGRGPLFSYPDESNDETQTRIQWRLMQMAETAKKIKQNVPGPEQANNDTGGFSLRFILKKTSPPIAANRS